MTDQPNGQTEVRISYKWGISCNPRPTTWSGRIAGILRGYADRLDGCNSLAIQMRSEPEISRETHIEIQKLGVRYMELLLKGEVVRESTESALQTALPDLFRA